MSQINEATAQQGAKGTDEINDGRPIRDIRYTEKGLQYQVDLRLQSVKRLISDWHNSAEQLSIVLSDSDDPEIIKGQRDQLINCMKNLRGEYNLLKSLLGVEGDRSPISQRFENIEQEHQKLMSSASDTLREIKSESMELFSDVKSIASRRSHKSSSSQHSQKQQLTAKTEALKIKLKYLDVESKVKLEYDKIQAQKNLDITQATLVAHETFDEEDSKPNVPTESKADLVRKFVSAHPSSVPVPKSEPAIPVLTSAPVTSATVTSQEAHVSETMRPKVTSSSIPKTHAVIVPPSDNVGRLNPLAGSFKPKMSLRGPDRHRFNEPSHNVHESYGDRADHHDHSLTSFAKSIADHVSLSRLPPPEPPVFSGDPLLYPSWKVAFSTLIEQRNIPKAEQIHYLMRYLSGPAKEAIENYFLLSTDNAYDEAKLLLDERFGDPFVIGNAFRDKLEKWPKIASRDSKALLKFADFLKQCHAAMCSLGTLRILDDDRENRKIMAKLPDWLATRWGRKVFQWKEEVRQFPPFNVFMEFVSKEAKIASDPVTSLKDHKADNSTGKNINRKFESRSFAVESKATERKGFQVKCPLCSKDHYLDRCDTFLEMGISDRKDFVRSKNLCFGCLKGGHISKKCKHKKKCEICSKLHPTVFHGDILHSKIQPKESSKQASKETKPTVQTSHASVSFLSNSNAISKNSMVLPVFLLHCDNPENERLVYAMLDTQSDTSFILEDTCRSLGLSGTPVTLKLSTMLAENKDVKSARFKGLMVRGHDSTLRIKLPDAFSRKIIPANRSHIPTPDIARSWSHLNSIADKLLPLVDCEIGLLIGYNCSQALMPREVITPDRDGPYGQKTDLGWGIVGIVDPHEPESADDVIGLSHRTMICEVPNDLMPSQQSCDQPCLGDVAFAFRTKVKVVNPAEVSRMLELDFSERTECDDTMIMSQDDKSFIKSLSEEIAIDASNGHYSMPLPFRGGPPRLPNNKCVAFRRLVNLTKKFKTDARYFEMYKEFIENLLRNGHAEIVQPSEMTKDEGFEWYIPHHGVFHPRKPDKLRVVFDCSSKFQDKSLNDHLLQGPDLTNTLIGVLCRFRQQQIAFTCDIEQMFHQFYVHEKHRNYLRFLWWKDPDMTKVVVYRMCVHLFGATSSPGCANFGLKQIATDNENAYGSNAANFLRNDFYVDDGLKSVSSVSEATHMIKQSQEMCANGRVRLHKFSSNSKEVLCSIPVEDRAVGLKDIDIFKDNLPVEYTLGVQWNIQSDAFQFRITLSDKPLTRRGILSTVSSVYDPLGFISPVVLVGKQILQQTCKDNVDWDDPIPEDLHMRWERWRNDLKELSELQVRRCVMPDDFDEVQVREFHHFSDASTVGYGQCSYLRLMDVNGRIHCSLLMGKSRVAPKKAMTIPRLELTAAVVSVKVHSLLKREFEFDDASHYFWTDSSVVLGYIMNDAKRFHIFVGNRVQLIRDRTEQAHWKYVPSKDNPADIASRGATASELIDSNWIKGPSFLWSKELPKMNDSIVLGDLKDDPEVKEVQTFATSMQPVVNESMLERLSYFSRWDKARRAIANCIKFMCHLKTRIRQGNGTRKNSDDTSALTVENLQTAEIEILRIVQKAHFEREIETIKRGGTISDGSFQRLDPFIDNNGLVRVGGRIRQSSEDYKLKHPVILPRKSHVTQLIIKHFHERVQHQGRGITTNEIRNNGFWIIGCSSAVTSTIYHCLTCRKLRGRTLDQKMADLPIDRVDPAPPFTYCGVDYFGPFYVKEGRKELKRYGVVFTCFTSRAVHLEIANSLDTDSFINALRRFLCLRGPIRQLRSDRGTNFIGAESELQRAVSEMEDERISEFLRNEGCDYFEFKMNVPNASHMGGVWERQIRTVRSILANLLHSMGKQLDDESLRTFMCEITAIINSRPLSVENINDPNSEALTPNHLLTMKSKIVMPPPGRFIRPDLYVRKRWRRIQYLANQFWFKWRNEYLNNLQGRDKWLKKRRNLEIGDVVMIKDDNLSRNMWRLGRISDAYHDEDGLVRKVKLIVGTTDMNNKGVRTSKLTELERPVHKLVLLLESDTGEFPTDEP